MRKRREGKRKKIKQQKKKEKIRMNSGHLPSKITKFYKINPKTEVIALVLEKIKP